MELTSAFKSEIFRPLATVISPGATSIGPYVFIVGYYVPRVRVFWEQHPSAFTAAIVVCVISSGLILENVGARIESKLWDARLSKTNERHTEEWNEYLQQKVNPEIVGQRYLQTIVMRLKFELAMGPALLVMLVGMIWLNHLYEFWPCSGLLAFAGFTVVLSGYLLYESYCSCQVLAKTRRQIVKATRTDQAPTTPSCR